MLTYSRFSSVCLLVVFLCLLSHLLYCLMTGSDFGWIQRFIWMSLTTLTSWFLTSCDFHFYYASVIHFFGHNQDLIPLGTIYTTVMFHLWLKPFTFWAPLFFYAQHIYFVLWFSTQVIGEKHWGCFLKILICRPHQNPDQLNHSQWVGSRHHIKIDCKVRVWSRLPPTTSMFSTRCPLPSKIV